MMDVKTDTIKVTEQKDNVKLGQRLKALRKMHCFSQEAVSEKIGVMRCTYYHYESGRTVPPAKILYALAELYDVPPEMILYPGNGETDNIPKKHSRQAELSDNELELVYYYRKLDERDRKDILLFAKLKGESSAEEK